MTNKEKMIEKIQLLILDEAKKIQNETEEKNF